MAHDLRISLLGGFSVVVDGSPVLGDAWRRNRARTLVKLLALSHGHRLHREQVIDTLWPSLDPDAAASNLRKATYFARQVLGAQHIRVRGELIALEAPALWVDVPAFEAAAQAGQSSEAVALYGGELLPEDRFEPWTEDPRERLQVRFHSLLLTEAGLLERSGQPEAAAELLDRLVASDPLHEQAHLALFRVLALAGSRHLAIARYRQLEGRLRDELGVEPGAAMRQLVDDIAAGRLPQAAVDEPQAQTPQDVDAVVPDADESRLVTVLSAAATFEQHDPEVGQRELASWMAGAVRIVERWGGVAETQPGGDLLGAFGVPSAHEDDAGRAFRAATELSELEPTSRIGLGTGEVVVSWGHAPPLRRITGAVIGLAMSLREAAEPGFVLTADRSQHAAGAGFRYSEPLNVRIAGNTMVVWRLVGEDRAELRSPREDPPLIGRSPELAAIVSLFEDTVASRRPRLVELRGPAGIGKSRLAREALAAVALRWPDAVILRGRCLSGGRGAIFGALGEILRQACGITIADSAREAQERLRRGLARLLRELDVADVEPTTFALATTAGITLAANPLEHLPAAGVSDRLAVAWPILASACAVPGPAVFLLEDLHWAYPELLDLIEQLVIRARGPLVVLATARPELHETRPGFGTSGDQVSTIAVRPLAEIHSRELLDSLMVGDDVEPRVRHDLLARAEGNPFFLEQLTHHLRSGGSTNLPDTLQSLLTARLDGLLGSERRVLQEAAVVGRTFWEGPIRAALPDERVSARLAALERKGFVVRRPTSSLAGQEEFTIRHALLHDVAYESLSRARRARAHAAVGAWLEELAGDRVDEVIDLLAHHYWSAFSPKVPVLASADGLDRATIRAKAFGYNLRAGDAARQRFVADRAIELHTRALTMAEGPNEELAALESLGEDHETAFHGDDAAAVYFEALNLARANPSRSMDRARLCRRLAWMMAWIPGGFRSSPEAAIAEAYVDEGLAFAGDDTERGWLLLARGACARLYRGSEPLGQGTETDPRRIGERTAAAEEAASIARDLGLDDLAALAGQALGMLYGLAGNYGEMVDLAARQVAALRPEDSRLDQSDAIRKLATHLINVRADFGRGLDLGWRCHEILGEAGAFGPHHLMHTLWPIMTSLFYLGRWDELLPPLREHTAAFRAEPATECQFVRDGPAIGAATFTLLGRAAEADDLARLLGDPLLQRDRASAWQARFASISGDPLTARMISDDKAREGRGYGPQHAFALLEALEALADWESARAFLPVARSTIPGNALLGPMSDRVAGQIKLAEGDTRGAPSLLRRAVRGFRRFKAPFEEARSLEVLARALPTKEARVTRAAARDLYARLGAGPAFRLLEAALGDEERAGPVR